MFYATGADGGVAPFVGDAGAEGVLASAAKSTGTPQVPPEQVLGQGVSAEFWINGALTGRWSTLHEPIASEPQLAELRVVCQDTVPHDTHRLDENQGNDDRQSGAMRPDLAGANLVAICHPSSASGHDFSSNECVAKQ